MQLQRIGPGLARRAGFLERLTADPEPLTNCADRVAVDQMGAEHLVAHLQVVLDVKELRPPLEQEHRYADSSTKSLSPRNSSACSMAVFVRK